MAYDREKAVAYAHRWAYGRNPRYANFDGMGGDCTNFVSQCLAAGGCAMNLTPTLGWYFYTLDTRSPAWSGVEYLYNFLTRNRGVGPYGSEVSAEQLLPGDLVQLSFDGERYGHCALIVTTLPEIRVAAHTFNSDNRPLGSYTFQKKRFIHLEGSR